MMPSMSATVRPASAIAVVAASSISSTGRRVGAAHVVGLADADDRCGETVSVHEAGGCYGDLPGGVCWVTHR